MRRIWEEFTYDFGTISPQAYTLHEFTFTQLDLAMVGPGWASWTGDRLIPEYVIPKIYVSGDNKVTVLLNNVDPIGSAIVGEITFNLVAQTEE